MTLFGGQQIFPPAATGATALTNALFQYHTRGAEPYHDARDFSEYDSHETRSDAEVLAAAPLLTPPPAKLNVADLERLRPGVYRLSQTPSVPFLKRLPDFRKGSAEIGVRQYDKDWYVCLSTALNVRWPFAATGTPASYRLNLHTHPGTAPSAFQPSRLDLLELACSPTGRCHLINFFGLVEYALPQGLPLCATAIDGFLAHEWPEWVHARKCYTRENWQSVAWDCRREFLEAFFGLRLLPWHRLDLISAALILKSK